MANIQLFITGGTISKVYNELTGELLCAETHIQHIMNQGRVKANINIKTLMLKDSLEMDNSDRDEIFSACKISTSLHIIVTHGTDTMVESAKKLSTIKNKTIILTGAMIPYALKNSDSLFNLGFALGVVQSLSSGIYICMNGQIFEWNMVKKNREEGIFESI